jgi:hypothetical protein
MHAQASTPKCHWGHPLYLFIRTQMGGNAQSREEGLERFLEGVVAVVQISAPNDKQFVQRHVVAYCGYAT